jgi:hypothetical protein
VDELDADQRHNPNVTLALDDTKNGEDMVILEGRAELLLDPAVNPTLPSYAAKYNSLLKSVGLTAKAMATVYSQAILITPTRFLHRQGKRGERKEPIRSSNCRRPHKLSLRSLFDTKIESEAPVL